MASQAIQRKRKRTSTSRARRDTPADASVIDDDDHDEIIEQAARRHKRRRNRADAGLQVQAAAHVPARPSMMLERAFPDAEMGVSDLERKLLRKVEKDTQELTAVERVKVLLSLATSLGDKAGELIAEDKPEHVYKGTIVLVRTEGMLANFYSFGNGTRHWSCFPPSHHRDTRET